MCKFSKSILVALLFITSLLCFSSFGYKMEQPVNKNLSHNNSFQVNACMPILDISYQKNNLLQLNLLKNNTNDTVKSTTAEDDLQAMWDKLSEQEKCIYKENILFLVLNPYIQEAVSAYYGGVRQYENPEIIYIAPKILKHIVQIRVITFVGPHNPPRGEETLTFEIDGSRIQLIDFKHKNADKG